ncbi:GIN domain-containing protein [Pedobacter sp. AW31-3R]|uniref:GIN domain-containing protein n=1 Tax=Pedobacter sp. AW31-3R TaxID=3445781 RepID=UPI003F9F669E
MKTLTKTVFALLLTATVATSSAFSNPVAAIGNPMVESGIEVPVTTQSFNRIWVAGNVKIILTQSEKEGITVGEDFNAKETSLQRSGQTLYVNSTTEGQVTIHVAVKDLYRIQAAGNAVVVMNKSFDVKNLQLFLSQQAKVKVNAKIESLYTVITEDATLKINGSAAEHTLMASNMKNVKFGEFLGSRANQTLDGKIKLALLAK